MAPQPDFLDLLWRDGVIRSPKAALKPLTGGVSSEIYLVEDGAECFVIKRALPKLKVQAEWFADITRNRYEWQFIRYVARFAPASVPALRFCSATDGYFAMEYLGDDLANWKQLLLKGEADPQQAARAASLLASIHRHSSGDAEAASTFDTTANFHQLRIEPYLLATGAKHPALRPVFEAEARRLAATRECLIHGDFSPKNILVSPDRMVLLDCEVAWYGDPAFDVAFLLTHLFLKSLLHSGMRPMIDTFHQAYRSSLPLETRASRLLLMLLLARVDGKSPVEYLTASQQNFIRDFVQSVLPSSPTSLTAIEDYWFARLTTPQ